ncbi:predicted protein [Histoplasma capsulatum G186AR]|uniref:Uncharacterized protein n=1 Tax=Ajellomyces capsulatus (strain G186AR / H82 / ATCC MYA-2454 / RMSCC 2432) TaxID=447093 RepID=C0NZQ7_AJECG|nr:uncharacterized protein HCBG_08637 [Histoplasma capsulatum G186AR]EEH02997.1 predicted protein [Histoplasma capsulatum G186AR]
MYGTLWGSLLCHVEQVYGPSSFERIRETNWRALRRSGKIPIGWTVEAGHEVVTTQASIINRSPFTIANLAKFLQATQPIGHLLSHSRPNPSVCSCIKPVDISSKSVETDIKEVHLSQAEMLESEQQISLILDPGKHILQTQELHQFNQPADVSMTGYSWLEIWPDWCHFQSLYGAAFYVIRIFHGSPLTEAPEDSACWQFPYLGLSLAGFRRTAPNPGNLSWVAVLPAGTYE